MGLKNAFMVKTVLGDTDLELKADPGESFLIKDIRIYNPATAYATLQIEKTTVGYFRVNGTLGSHLPFLTGRSGPVINTHGHKALTVMATETAADSTTFVSITEGDGTPQVGVKVSHAGGAGADIDLETQSVVATSTAIPMLTQKTLLGLMVELGLMTGYPVAVGETFRISGVKQAGAIQMVIYEIYDAEDMTPVMPNGSRALEYIYCNYGNTGAVITQPGTDLYTTTVNPGEFLDFPFNKVVPAKTEIDLVAVLASDFAPAENTAGDYLHTQYLKFIAERITLFDEDRQGLLMLGPAGVNVGARDRVGEGQSLLGNYSDVDMRLPFRLPTPLTYLPGDDLDIYLTTDGDGTYQDIALDEHEIALVQVVRRVE